VYLAVSPALRALRDGDERDTYASRRTPGIATCAGSAPDSLDAHPREPVRQAMIIARFSRPKEFPAASAEVATVRTAPWSNSFFGALNTEVAEIV
jgi:hypothetical protein